MDILNYSQSLLDVYQKEMIKLHDVITTQSDFQDIVKLIQVKTGKLVFSGVGKSGHIAKKAAATFASLGISSFFIHSTEASHGDIGMLDDNDILFALSNSGNTTEIKDIIATCRKKGIKICGISKTKESFIGENSDFFLELNSHEAMPELPAPTCSTANVLTILDIIACCVSKLNHFSMKQYAINHPGGKLGEMAKEQG